MALLFPAAVLQLVSLTNRPDMAADNGAHFPIVGQHFMETGEVRQGAIGQAPSLFFSTRALVDFAQQYFSRAL